MCCCVVCSVCIVDVRVVVVHVVVVVRVVETDSLGHTRRFNIDWEPTGEATDADGIAYAAFLDTVGSILHESGLTLQVDIGLWSPVWNMTALGATQHVDVIMTMATYAGEYSVFQSRLDGAVAAIGPRRLGVGLMTTDPTTGETLSKARITARVDAIQAAGVSMIGVWVLPLDAAWWPILSSFRTAPHTHM